MFITLVQELDLYKEFFIYLVTVLQIIPDVINYTLNNYINI